MIRPVTLRRGAAAAVATVLATVAPVVAAGSATAAGPTREQIYAQLGVDRVPADYVLLIDTSGSMAAEGRYDRVRRSLRSFLSGLSSGDHVALYTFDEVAAPRYVGPAADADRILSRLPAAPTLGAGTDIGAALDSALGELERPGAADVASVVLVTDGRHEPPAGSAYPSSTGRPWTALRDRVRRLDRSSLHGYALPLAAGASGAALLRTVLPDTTVLDPSAVNGLASFLDRSKQRARSDKARRLLGPDVGSGVTARWVVDDRVDLTGGEVSAVLTLRSTARHVPLTVEGLAASAIGSPLTVSGLPPSVSLAPGATVTLPVRMRWTASAGLLPVRRTRTAEPTLTVTGAVASPWASALARDVPLRIRPQPADGSRQVRAEAVVGSPVTLPLTVAVVLLLAATLLAGAYARTHPRLRGRLRVRSAVSGAELVTLDLRGRSVQLPSGRLPGSGTVRAVRPSGWLDPTVELAVTYSPDGSVSRRSVLRCPPGRSVMIGGLSFEHGPATAAGPVAVPGPAVPLSGGPGATP